MKKQSISLVVAVLIALVVGAFAQHVYTLNANEFIDISGNGCKPKVVPSVSPNVVRVRCLP